jgi:nitroreductase
MSAYDTIFLRRSVRKYEIAPLTGAELAKVQSVLDSAPQMPGQSARFELVNADKVKGLSAPHAVLAHAPADSAALANIGYTLQTLDLYLQENGFGSLWMGMARPLAPAPDYRVLLAFGKTDVPLRRAESEFKRKKISDVSNEENAIARAARLAPSAVNFQPWKLEFAPGKVAVQFAPGLVGKLVASKFQQIDLGICLKHAVLALEHEGKIVTGIAPQGGGKTFAVVVEYEK